MENEKFQNKYRIPSARLQTWDYRWQGSYFITICTRNREHFFGKVQNGKMELSPVGVVANVFWYEIQHRVKNITLGEFMVMPNHMHGILILNDGDDNNVNVETLHATSLQSSLQSTTIPPIQSSIQQPLQIQKNEFMAKISPKIDSISTIVRSYKSAVTKHANRLGFEFGWQTRFHDHIIRDEKSFNTISTYIIENPEKWENDKFHEKNLLIKQIQPSKKIPTNL